MKKVLAFILAAGLLLALLASCARQTPSVNTPSDVQVDPYAGLGDFTMVIGHAQPEGNPRYVSMEKFKNDVEAATNGHVKVELYGNGMLGTEKEMLEQVLSNRTQGMRGGQFDFSPRLLMFTLPFLTSNRAQITALLHSDLAKKVCAEAELTTGTVIINLCDAGGYRQFSNNVRPITKPEDLAGLNMRTNGMKTVDLAFRAMGAETVSIPYADLYAGLKNGEADGQENPWVNAQSMKLYEVQTYFTQVNYQFHPDPFYVNATWWNSLPEEFQTIISKCATDMGKYNDQLIDQNSDAAKQYVIASGAQVYEPTDEELQAFRDAMLPVYDQCVAEGICTAAELEQMLEIVANAG